MERHGGGGGIPDPKHLETISNDLKTLAALASARSDANDKGMRDLAQKRKDFIEEEQVREREREDFARERDQKAQKEKDAIKKEADEENEVKERTVGKQRKKKEQSVAREVRPLNHGAHGLARQDGLDLPLEGT